MKHGQWWKYLLSAWLFIVQPLMIAWALRPKEYFEKFDWNEEGNWVQRIIAKFVGFTAFIGFLFVIGAGYKSLLWFLPSSWGGHNEEGDWISWRNTISGFIGFAGATYILSLLIGHNEKRREQLTKESESKSQDK